jgi:hypothetical protein
MTTIIMSTGSMTQAAADRQMEAVRKIMAERGLDYGPALNYYIKQKQGLMVLQQTPVAVLTDNV